MLGLERLLPVAPYHDYREEATDDGGTENDEDDGDADGPDAWQEEGVKDVVVIHEGLHRVRTCCRTKQKCKSIP